MNALAPQHVEDMKTKSGLIDTTIDIIKVKSTPPHEIRIKGVESALEFPYFALDGSVNGFVRRKLFPPVKTSNGTMRYWQPKDSLPHLYLPPLVDWQTIAKNATTELIITEGEKKAAAGCQQGLTVAGVGGVWCWRSTTDAGEKFALPMLDEFIWTHRPVLICPDSDAFHDDHGLQILMGFFALAKELQQRGAAVQFVRLPHADGGKLGLDDWLLVPGHDVEHSWPKLERIALDDARFSELTSWWQKWRERQATQSAIKNQDAEALTLNETAGLYVVQSKKHHAEISLDRLTDRRDSVYAEATVMLGGTELLSGVDLNLKSDRSQKDLVKSLNAYAKDVPWSLVLQKACALILKHHRRGEPSRCLNKDTVVAPLRYSLNPFCHQRKPTILFADGGTGKSTLGLFCGMLVSAGASIAGISALKGKVLYLDYEDDADTHARRLHAIQNGHPELRDAEISYQRCTESLPRMLHPLVRKIQEEHITFLIVDSLVAAAGGEASLEAVGKLFAAIRTLNIDLLCIGHVPKPQGDEPTKNTVYGSVFNQNYARMLWEVRREHAPREDSAILALTNPKSNDARPRPSFGLRVTQNEAGTSITYESFDLNQAPELAKVLPLQNQIRNLLESDGEPRSPKQIAEELGAKLASVTVTLSRHSGHKWHRIGDYHDGQWTVLNR